MLPKGILDTFEETKVKEECTGSWMRPIPKYVYFISILTNETFVMRFGITFGQMALLSLGYLMTFHNMSIKSPCMSAVEDGYPRKVKATFLKVCRWLQMVPAILLSLLLKITNIS